MNSTLDKKKTLMIGAFLMASFGWLGWIAIETAVSGRPLIHPGWFNAGLLVLAAVTSASMLLVVPWNLYRAWRTEVSEAGVSQLQLRGTVQVLWQDFTDARVSRHDGIDLYFPGGKVVIAAGLYTRPELVSEFVFSKLPRLSRAGTEA